MMEIGLTEKQDGEYESNGLTSNMNMKIEEQAYQLGIISYK